MYTRMTGHKSRTFCDPLEQINRRRTSDLFIQKPNRKSAPTPKCVNQSAGFPVKKKKR